MTCKTTLLCHGNWHEALFWLTVKLLKDCDRTVRKYKRWQCLAQACSFLTLEQYSPLGTLLKSQNCLHKMLVRLKVLLYYLEGVWMPYMKIWCLFQRLFCQLITKHRRTSQAFMVLGLSKFPADECFKLGKFQRTFFSTESFSCKILPCKNDWPTAGWKMHHRE